MRCDDRCIITVASIEDVPKFVTLIRASDKSRPVETSTDTSNTSTSDHPKTDEQTDEKNVE